MVHGSSINPFTSSLWSWPARGSHVLARLHRDYPIGTAKSRDRCINVTPFSSCPSVGQDIWATGGSPERVSVIKQRVLGEYTTLYGCINTQRAVLSNVWRWRLNYEVRPECSMCDVKECPWAGWRADVSLSLVSLLASCIDTNVGAASWSFLSSVAC